MSRGPAQLVHLVRRAVWNLVPRLPSPTDVTFVQSHLPASVADLFFTLDPRDQVHSIAVARRVQHAAGTSAELVEVALLHDIGKTHAKLGVVGRASATLLEWTPWADLVVRRADPTVPGHHQRLLPRIGRYLCYEELGAADLVGLGYRPDSLSVRWAREHHWPEHEWSIPIEFGWVLSAADH